MDSLTFLDSPRAGAAARKCRSGRKSLRNGAGAFVEALEPRALLSAVAWSVLSDTSGSSPGNPFSLRGLALSNDGSAIYAGYIHSSAVDEISTSSSTVEASVATPGQQAKGLATDDRGFVYATLNTGSSATTQPWAIYHSDLTPVAGSPFTSATTASKQIGGIAVQKLNGHYFAYIGSNKGAATIERWNVDDPSSPVLDASWGTSGIIDLKSAAFSLGSNTFVNGLTIGPDGTVFAAGGVNATDRGDAVFEISADGLSVLHTANVSGAMDDAILDGKLFVTQYLGPNSSIAVLDESDLSTVATITDSPKGPYNNVNPDAAGYDAGYSGIDIGPDGKVYVAEQIYNNDGLFHDRILVSSPLAAPSFTSGASAAFALNSANTFTVATTGSPTAALTETGALPTGVTFVDNLDGTATLAGTPSTAGVYHFTITASNYLADVLQSFTLTVQQAPAITSAATTTFAASAPGAFTVTTTGTPAAALTETGPLPSGVTFVDNGDGTATLSGTAAFGSQGDYPFSIKASNGVAPTRRRTSH